MSRAHNERRVFFGAFIIIVGVLALLDNLHLFDLHDVLQFWPMVFIAIGGLKIVQARHSSGYFVGGAFVTVGVLMTLQHMGLISFRWHDWWPLMLILGGAMVIHKGLLGKQCAPRISSEENGNTYLDTVAVMSGNKIKNDTQDFRGGEITAVMGGRA